jgi:hypothetical protein
MEKEAARKQKIMRDPKLLSKYAKEFSDVELAQALNRFRTQASISEFTKKKERSESDKSQSLKGGNEVRAEKIKSRAERKKIKLQDKLKRKEEKRKKKEIKPKTINDRLKSLSEFGKYSAASIKNLNTLGKQGRELTDELGLTTEKEGYTSWWSGVIDDSNIKQRLKKAQQQASGGGTP